jgi:tRNA nucleotidyltransferase (CCA-adding enzyme)
MEREAHDFDIATNARPEQVAALFPRSIETGLKHGTITVMLGGEGFEVTTFRGEGVYSDGRRPDEVQFLNSIEEDLARRDFTMNAIAFDPLRGSYCDPFGGVTDIERKVIRAVGVPLERFTEDGLRVLRAIRFMVSLDFSLDLATVQAIPNPESLTTFSRVSAERVTDEWFKIMKSRKPSPAFQVMADLGLLALIVPEMIPMIGCGQNKYHAFDVWKHTMETVDACPSGDPVLRWGALFHDIGKPASKGAHPVHGDATFYNHENIGAEMMDTLLPRLKLSGEDASRITHLVRHHFIRYESSWPAATVRRWIRKVGLDSVTSLCTLARADIAGKGPARVQLEEDIINELESRVANMKITEVIPTSTKVLTINGNDVMKHLGIGPGPTIGKVLNALLEVVTDNPDANTRDNLLALASGLVI